MDRFQFYLRVLHWKDNGLNSRGRTAVGKVCGVDCCHSVDTRSDRGVYPWRGATDPALFDLGYGRDRGRSADRVVPWARFYGTSGSCDDGWTEWLRCSLYDRLDHLVGLLPKSVTGGH